MNVYFVAKIKEDIIDATNMPIPILEQIPYVMVHGADNFGLAVGMLKEGLPMGTVRRQFCGNCGGRLPCGCSNPHPQE